MIEQPSTGEQPVAWSISYTGGLANFYRTESEAIIAYDYLTKKYGAVKHRFIVPLHTGAEVAALRAELAESKRTEEIYRNKLFSAIKGDQTLEKTLHHLDHAEQINRGLMYECLCVATVARHDNTALRTKLAETEALLVVATSALEALEKAFTKLEGAQQK